MTAIEKLKEWQSPHTLATLIANAIDELKPKDEESLDESVGYIEALVDNQNLDIAIIGCWAIIGLQYIQQEVIKQEKYRDN